MLPLAGRFMLRRSIPIALALGFAVLSSIVLPATPDRNVVAADYSALVLCAGNLAIPRHQQSVLDALSLEVLFYLIYVLLLAVARDHLTMTLTLLFAAMGASAMWPMGWRLPRHGRAASCRCGTASCLAPAPTPEAIRRAYLR
jgi:hypothetical protein